MITITSQHDGSTVLEFASCFEFDDGFPGGMIEKGFDVHFNGDLELHVGQKIETLDGKEVWIDFIHGDYVTASDWDDNNHEIDINDID